MKSSNAEFKSLCFSKDDLDLSQVATYRINMCLTYVQEVNKIYAISREDVLVIFNNNPLYTQEQSVQVLGKNAYPTELDKVLSSMGQETSDSFSQSVNDSYTAEQDGNKKFLLQKEYRARDKDDHIQEHTRSASWFCCASDTVATKGVDKNKAKSNSSKYFSFFQKKNTAQKQTKWLGSKEIDSSKIQKSFLPGLEQDQYRNLYQSISQGDVELFQSIVLSNSALLDSKSNDIGLTPWDYLIFSGKGQILEWINWTYHNINKQNSLNGDIVIGNIALNWDNHQIESNKHIVREIILYSNFSIKNHSGYNPLSLIVMNNTKALYDIMSKIIKSNKILHQLELALIDQNDQALGPLHTAILLAQDTDQTKWIELLSRCIKNNHAIKNIVNLQVVKSKMAPIHIAAITGNPKLLKCVLDVNEVKIGMNDIDAHNFLHYLAFIPNKDALKYYFKQHKDWSFLLEAFCTHDILPLYILLNRQSEDICLVVLKQIYSSKNQSLAIYLSKVDNKIPLHICLEKKYWSCVKFLLTQSPQTIIAQDANGNTALHYIAQMSDDVDAIMHLLKLVAKEHLISLEIASNVLNSNGLYPIHIATINGNIAVLKFLIDQVRCDYKMPDGYGTKPLEMAKMNIINLEKDDAKIVKVFLYLLNLLDLSGDQKAYKAMEKVYDDKNLLQMCLIKNYWQCVKSFLIEFPKAIVLIDQDGKTAMHYMAQMDANATASFLPILQEAILRSNPLSQKLMQCLQVVSEMPDLEGDSPIHYAIAMKNFEMLKFMVDVLKFNINISNRYGQKILEISRNDMQIHQYLLSKHKDLMACAGSVDNAYLIIENDDTQSHISASESNFMDN